MSVFHALSASPRAPNFDHRNKFVLPNLEDQYALRSLDWLASTVSPVPVLATIAAKGGGFIAQVRARPDVELLTVTAANSQRILTLVQ